MSYPEDTQYFDNGYIPDVAPLDYGESYSNDEGSESVAELGCN